MGVNVRSKGATGERDAIRVVQTWADEVCELAGLPPVVLARNLEQSRSGGCDVVGIDWLALEVKRHENLAIPGWWRQAVRQAGPGQVPVLMYRQNRTPWKFRVALAAAHPGVYGWTTPLTVDMALDEMAAWFKAEFWARLHAGG